MASEKHRTLSPLVLDASVAINLLATERPWEILSCQGFRAFVPEKVVGEVSRCPVTKRVFDQSRHPIRISPNVDVVELTHAETAVFVTLAQSLGDGEAASIALAMSRRLPLALDDRRARAIAREHDGEIVLRWTTELLRAAAVIDTFAVGEPEAMFQAALTRARMYVPRDR